MTSVRSLAAATIVVALTAGISGCSQDPVEEQPSAAITLGAPPTSASADTVPSPGSADESPGDDAQAGGSPAGEPPGDELDPELDLDESPIVAGLVVVDELADLDVDDQVGDGRTVAVEEVRLSQGNGFVAIYDTSLAVLGVGRVGVDTQPLTIQLSDPVQADGDLLAMLHLDDGDGRFDPERDPTVLADGEAVGEDFHYVVRSG